MVKVKLRYRRGHRSTQEHVEPVYIEAPPVFSLTENYSESVKCLQRLKEAVFRVELADEEKRPIFLDLATIEHLHPAAAVVLAAELDRWRRVKGVRLQPRNLQQWKMEVKQLVSDMGMFDLLNVRKKHLRDIPSARNNNVALRFVSDDRNDREQTDMLSEELVRKVPVFARKLTTREDMALSTALAEASLNSVQHAYEKDELKYPSAGQRWWAAAVYESNRSVVKFFVYDQGVGIPQTLPNTPVGKKILNRLFGSEVYARYSGSDESKMIEAALKGGFSSTEMGNRGKGFPQIVAAISNAGGRLRVISGHGSAIYSNEDGPSAGETNELHLGGTLLEWTFKVGEM